VLEQAIVVEPDFLLAYVHRAQAWMGLGDESRARAAAQKALGNSGGLARPQWLLIDGLYHETGHEWDQAVEDYRALLRCGLSTRGTQPGHCLRCVADADRVCVTSCAEALGLEVVA
jgi:tetratricopeptide (TPR) repeat protein